MSEAKEKGLSELLKLKCIKLGLECDDKKKILAELVDLIAKSGKVKNKKALLGALLDREELGSTAIGHGVAIPHAKIEGVKEPLLAFGRALEGVDFNSLDGEKTYIFFVLISPKVEVGQHLKILAKISHIIKDKFIVGLFRKAKDADNVIKILTNSEASLKH